MTLEKSDADPGAANRPETDGDTKSNSTGLDHAERPKSTTPGQAKCSICQSTFRRPEHLKRHFRSHTKEKPFECAQCGRNFSRTDTLHRHELSHHTLGAQGGRDRAHRITVKTFRACFKCALARVRCSGGTPCVRCENRTLECQYPTERRSKTKPQKEASHKSSLESGSDNESRSKDSYQSHLPQKDSAMTFTQAGSEPLSQSLRYQTSQFQLQMNEPQASSNKRPAQDRADCVQNNRQDRRASQLGDPNPSLPFSSSNEPTTVESPPFASFGIKPGSIHPSIPTSEIRNSLPVDTTLTAPELEQQMRNLQAEIVSSNVDTEMTAAHDQQVQLGLGQPFFDHSMLSTINWLPSDLFTDPTNGTSFSSGLSLQSNYTRSPNPSLTQTAWLPPVTNAEQIDPSLAGGLSQSAPGSISRGMDTGSPNRYSDTIGEESTHLETGDTTKRQADCYVDGAGARLPKYRKKSGSWSRSSIEMTDTFSQLNKNDTNPEFGFPLIQDLRLESVSEEELSFDRHIESSTYDQIHHHFLQLCCKENFLYRKFVSEDFPSVNALSKFIHFYFDSFQSVYPVFHSPTFNPNKCHWLVTLAVSAIGCRVASTSGTDKCAMAFDEFLRRAIHVEKEKDDMEQTPLWLLQVMALNCVGLLYSNNERSRISALNNFGDLVTFVNRKGLLSSSRAQPIEQFREEGWGSWIKGEMRIRTGYFIWLVDCTIAYHLDTKSFLSLDDGQAPLPSHENLWQAKCATDWEQQLDQSSEPENVSLYDAVHIMYIEKKLISGIGEFGHILLIHALYHRMWEVGDYFRRPLSFWNPTAKKQNRDSAIPSGSVWLPGIPSYSKWRNSACDCLDILHWTANSTIAKAAGLEHPTVLHLHVARIILLTPFREIRALATSLATRKIRWSQHHQTIEWHYILRWMKHDQYKARSAIIHAGTILWHIRRYSTNAFHEPMAAFLAILVLWAYGSCQSSTSRDSHPTSGLEQNPAFIHLDRPCDDELVQLFVREGQAMSGNITGVGDICAPHGPQKILRVGCETLGSLTSWGISKRLIMTLTKLAGLDQNQGLDT